MEEQTSREIQAIVASKDPFPVDFDRAWQWIGYSRKDHALSALSRGFIEGRDFSRARGESTGGRPAEEIRLTKDCFKQFCMMAGTEKGRETRLYFIQCEEQLQSMKKFYIPSNYAEALRLAADQTEKLEAAEKQIEGQRPAVEYVEHYVSADGSHSLRSAAGILKMRPVDLQNALIERKVLYRNKESGKIWPYGNYLERGLFVEKSGVNSTTGKLFVQIRVTGKGMLFMSKMFRDGSKPEQLLLEGTEK